MIRWLKMSSSNYNTSDRSERRYCSYWMSRYRNLVLFVLCVSCMVNALFYLNYAAANQQRQNNGLFLMYQHSVVLEERKTGDYQDSDPTIMLENLSVSRKLQGESDLKSSVSSEVTVINPHNFDYVINKPDTCKENETVKVVVVVCTGISNFEARQAIRDTWANYLNEPNVNGKLVFLVGVGDNKQIQKKLRRESIIYNDIVQENFVDSYRNLSLKSVAVLKWVKDYCKNAEFVFKVDDDIFVNIPNLIKYLDKYSKKVKDFDWSRKYIIGHLFVGARPIQDKKSKWYTPKEWFSEEVYPDYVSGTSYIVSKDAVEDLYDASLYIKPFWLEDIYITGLCAKKAKIHRAHNPAISFQERSPNGCAYKNAITGHKVKSLEMYKIYTHLMKSYERCGV